MTIPRFLKKNFVSITEVFTVGYPFCGFKILSGIALSANSSHTALQAFATALILLGGLDVLVNTINLLALLMGDERKLEPCTFAIITLILRKRSRDSYFTWQDFGNSIDVLLSLTLIAIVIGAGLLKHLSPQELLIWNISVIFNVLGAGLGRFFRSLNSLGNRN